jgi:hypothetical protein
MGRAIALLKQQVLLKSLKVTVFVSSTEFSGTLQSLAQECIVLPTSKQPVVKEGNVVVVFSSKRSKESGNRFDLSDEEGSLVFGLGSQSSPVLPREDLKARIKI